MRTQITKKWNSW